MKTVNFIQAINSGKRFGCVEKRNSDFDKVFCKFNDEVSILEELLEFGGFVFRTVVNSKFELEERKIEITESEFDQAVKMIGKNYPYNRSTVNTVCDFLKKELVF